MGRKPALHSRGVRFGAAFAALVAVGHLGAVDAAAQGAHSGAVTEMKPAAVHSTQATPTAPKAQVTPSPKAQATPKAPVAPATPKAQATPTQPKAPATQATPKAQATPPAPKASASAVAPKAQVTAVPKVQVTPVAPKAPTAPPAAKPPETQVAPTPVAAPTQTNMEQAKLVYDQAVAAYEEHRYRDAIDLFLHADALRPNPAFSFNIGTAYEDMGDSAMALLHYRAYLRKLPKAFDREDVELRVRRLEGVLADKGLQQVTIISNPSDAIVILDGKPRGVSPWTGEVAPGAHVVTLSLQGYADETRDFDLPSRRSIDVPVTLKKPEPEMSTQVVDLNRRVLVEPKASWEYIRPVTWGVLGVSVASFGAALGFELSRSALEARSERADTDVGRLSLRHDAERSELWAKSFLMFAIGMGATSIVLGYQNIDDGLQAETQRLERVSLGCTSFHDCGVSVSGSF